MDASNRTMQLIYKSRRSSGGNGVTSVGGLFANNFASFSSKCLSSCRLFSATWHIYINKKRLTLLTKVIACPLRPGLLVDSDVAAHAIRRA